MRFEPVRYRFRKRRETSSRNPSLNVFEQAPRSIESNAIPAGARILRQAHHHKTVRVNARRETSTGNALLHFAFFGEQKSAASIRQECVAFDETYGSFRPPQPAVGIRR